MADRWVLCLVVCLLVACSVVGGDGQGEDTGHGARSPHERFSDDHYKKGVHDDDLDHQAILGSKSEAETFDQLSPAESKRRLRLIAKKMDTNSDGFVSKEELTAWIEKSLQLLDLEEVKERFDEIDMDKDMRITWREYRLESFGNEKLTDEEDIKLLAEDERYFNAADKNGDGWLNEEEFAAFQNPEHHAHMHQTLIELTLKDKDVNKDGKLDFHEFMADVGDKPDSEWYKVEKDRFENDYDKDKDGFLNEEEMKLWLVPDVGTTARDEMNHLLKQADKDKDGQLSIDEIVAEHALFVGSEATNYGEHLETVRDEL